MTPKSSEAQLAPSRSVRSISRANWAWWVDMGGRYEYTEDTASSGAQPPNCAAMPRSTAAWRSARSRVHRSQAVSKEEAKR